MPVIKPSMMSSKFSRQILVVEDDLENRDAMVRVLEGAGYKTTATDNGEDALNELLNQNMDVVISDLHLPGMDGVELLKRAKAAADVEVIMVTGYGTVEIAVEALKEGAYDFITKPVRKKDLLHRVHKVIRDIAARRRMEAERDLFARLVHSSSDAIVTSSLNGTVTSVNPAAEALFGYSAVEMIGRPGFMARLVPGDRAGEAMELLGRFSDGNAVELETVRIKKNGSRCVVSLTVSPIRDGLGCVVGYSEVIRNITERQRQMLRRELLAEAGKSFVSSLDYEETLKTIAKLSVRQLADCCLIDILQNDGSIRRAAGAFSDASRHGLWERMQTYPEKTPPFAQLVLEAGVSVLVQEVPAGFIESAVEDAEHLCIMRELDPKSFIAVPLKARGHLLGAVVFISTHLDRQYGPNDVPFVEEIAATAALAIDNASLFAQAQRAVTARDAVLEVVAHDLRNPLTNIMMSATLLSGNAPVETDQRQRMASQTQKAVRQMNRMIQDLLDIASMEAGRLRLDLKPVSTLSLIADVVEANRAHAGGRDLRAELSVPLPNIEADPDRILQVFSNLIGNAIKFTPENSHIVVGGTPERDTVRFWVHDNGPGISPDHLPHLFNRFWQPTNADRRGVGLGLSICKGIVEAHGGNISVKSVPDYGTTFSFSLPILTRPLAEAPTASTK